nr:unnamed protein product [Callosobruchus analis]
MLPLNLKEEPIEVLYITTISRYTFVKLLKVNNEYDNKSPDYLVGEEQSSDLQLIEALPSHKVLLDKSQLPSAARKKKEDSLTEMQAAYQTIYGRTETRHVSIRPPPPYITPSKQKRSKLEGEETNETSKLGTADLQRLAPLEQLKLTHKQIEQLAKAPFDHSFFREECAKGNFFTSFGISVWRRQPGTDSITRVT